MSKEIGGKWTPSAKQKAVAERLIDPDGRQNITKILKELDIPKSTYYQWNKDPQYVNWVSSQVSYMMKGSLPRLANSLVRNAEMGSAPHMKMALEMIGEYTQRVDINMTNEKLKQMNSEDLEKILDESGYGTDDFG